MAVRAFETDARPGLVVVGPAPLRRRDIRRTRRAWYTVGVVGLLVPFLAALIVLGVAR